jgi:quinate dehydrogenase
MASTPSYKSLPPTASSSAATTAKQPCGSDFSTLDRHGYLFGKKIKKSLSPLLHRVIYEDLNLNWSQIRLDSDDMEQFLQLIRHPQFYGKSEQTLFHWNI